MARTIQIANNGTSFERRNGNCAETCAIRISAFSVHTYIAYAHKQQQQKWVRADEAPTMLLFFVSIWTTLFMIEQQNKFHEIIALQTIIFTFCPDFE